MTGLGRVIVNNIHNRMISYCAIASSPIVVLPTNYRAIIAVCTNKNSNHIQTFPITCSHILLAHNTLRNSIIHTRELLTELQYQIPSSYVYQISVTLPSSSTTMQPIDTSTNPAWQTLDILHHWYKTKSIGEIANRIASNERSGCQGIKKRSRLHFFVFAAHSNRPQYHIQYAMQMTL